MAEMLGVGITLFTSLLYFAVWLVVLLLCLAIYILSAVAYKRLADKLACENSWLAWLPYGQDYIAGLTGDCIMKQEGENDWYLRWIALGGAVVLPTVATVARYIAAYRIFHKYASEKAVVYLVLSILLPFMLPIFLLRLLRLIPQQGVQPQGTPAPADFVEAEPVQDDKE